MIQITSGNCRVDRDSDDSVTQDTNSPAASLPSSYRSKKCRKKKKNQLYAIYCQAQGGV